MLYKITRINTENLDNIYCIPCMIHQHIHIHAHKHTHTCTGVQKGGINEFK